MSELEILKEELTRVRKSRERFIDRCLRQQQQLDEIKRYVYDDTEWFSCNEYTQLRLGAKQRHLKESFITHE